MSPWPHLLQPQPQRLRTNLLEIVGSAGCRARLRVSALARVLAPLASPAPPGRAAADEAMAREAAPPARNHPAAVHNSSRAAARRRKAGGESSPHHQWSDNSKWAGRRTRPPHRESHAPCPHIQQEERKRTHRSARPGTRAPQTGRTQPHPRVSLSSRIEPPAPVTFTDSCSIQEKFSQIYARRSMTVRPRI